MILGGLAAGVTGRRVRWTNQPSHVQTVFLEVGMTWAEGRDFVAALAFLTGTASVIVQTAGAGLREGLSGYRAWKKFNMAHLEIGRRALISLKGDTMILIEADRSLSSACFWRARGLAQTPGEGCAHVA